MDPDLLMALPKQEVAFPLEYRSPLVAEPLSAYGHLSD
jgi:hypothetical protein